MRKFGVAIFPDEKTVSNGSRALKELGESGVTVYAAVIIVKHSNGNISVLDQLDKGSHATAIAALIGGLAGLFARRLRSRGGGPWCSERTLCRNHRSWS